jgi:SAM-dependent methyltransferase
MRPCSPSSKHSNVEPHALASAANMRSALEGGLRDARAFRAALADVAAADRDTWVDRALGLPEPPTDGPELPRGCVPYLPCSVDTLLRAIDSAAITESDVFVDVGSGLGRALTLVHLLTGASAVGLEIQPALVRESRKLASRLQLTRVTTLEGDASALVSSLPRGSVWLLYCPFSGQRLSEFLARLEPLARAEPLRICGVDLADLECPWLLPQAAPAANLRVYRATKRA